MKKIILALSLMVSSAAMAVCNPIVPGPLTAAMLNAAIAGPCITSGTIQGAIISNSPIIGSTGSFTTLAATVGYTGVASSAAAAAGTLGEYAASSVAASAVSLTSGSAVSLTSVSLTAGDWDVSGSCTFTAATSTSITKTICGLSATSGVVGADGTYSRDTTAAVVPGAGEWKDFLAPVTRFLINTTTTIYLIGQSTFTASTQTAGGAIRARRVR